MYQVPTEYPAITDTRFSACIHPSRNFNIESLYICAERFGFVVDVRGAWPVMIKGLKSATYTTNRDMLNFIALTHPLSA